MQRKLFTVHDLVPVLRTKDFFARTGNMPEISQQLVEQLTSIAKSLRGVIDAIGLEKISVAAEIAAAVEQYDKAGICLRCGKKKPGRYTRGQCTNCYNDTRERITSGEVLESRLIEIGRLTPVAKTGGRKKVADRPEIDELTPLKMLDDPVSLTPDAAYEKHKDGPASKRSKGRKVKE